MNKGSIQEIQKALGSKGFDTPENGVLEGKTEKQLEAFQKSKDLPETGMPDRETVKQLGLDPDKIYRSNPPDEHEKKREDAEAKVAKAKADEKKNEAKASDDNKKDE